jgi:hypothetical protein
MEGMTLQQYAEILSFVRDNHRFGSSNSKNELPVKYFIKYVDNCFDMRTLKVWYVSFRSFGQKYAFATNSFVTKDYENLYDWVMAFLKGEFKDVDLILSDDE